MVVWILLVASLILSFVLIFPNRDKKGDERKSSKISASGFQRRATNDSHEEELDEEDDLIEEFLIIDLLDEEEDEER